jgi:hypothetical protein
MPCPTPTYAPTPTRTTPTLPRGFQNQCQCLRLVSENELYR